jgi:hypothetical protein
MNNNYLDILAKKYNTDKQSLMHNYTETYWELFKDKSDDKLNFLEIGVLNGSSTKMWKEFFINSEIKAIDINPDCKKYDDFRTEILIGEQQDHSFLKREFTDKNILFDIIVDDGSHLSSHQIKSFEYLFLNCLSEGGTYIIEDVCCSYWPSHEGSYKKEGTCIEYFKNKIDEINFYGSVRDNILHRNKEHLLKNYNNPTEFQKQIKGITFKNSLIIINK